MGGVMRTTNMGQDAITIKLLLEPWGRGGRRYLDPSSPHKKDWITRQCHRITRLLQQNLLS